MPPQEPFPRVMVQVRLRCGMGELAAVLHALESGSPQLFIDNLDLLSRRSYLAAGRRAAARLDVSFDLYGYLQAPRQGRAPWLSDLRPADPAARRRRLWALCVLVLALAGLGARFRAARGRRARAAAARRSRSAPARSRARAGHRLRRSRRSVRC